MTSRLFVLLMLGVLSGAAAAVSLPLTIDNGAASGPLSILPPEQAVRRTLEALPQLRASALNIDLASTGRARLASGPYEWSVRAGASRRTEQSGDRFNEQELIVERPVRWFGKAGKDAAIGEKGTLLAQAAFEDAWHEAGHSLM